MTHFPKGGHLSTEHKASDGLQEEGDGARYELCQESENLAIDTEPGHKISSEEPSGAPHLSPDFIAGLCEAAEICRRRAETRPGLDERKAEGMRCSELLARRARVAASAIGLKRLWPAWVTADEADALDELTRSDLDSEDR